MRRWTALLCSLIALASAADADVPGNFVGPGTYATEQGCKKLEAIAAGGFKNVETVPETLTIQGFLGWEGACTFRSISEIEKGRKWKASMDCHEGAQEGPESDIFERLDARSIKVTVMGNDTVFVRCDGKEGK